MFVIVENIIFLASFDVRLAHAGTSVVFSYLVFCNFNFCLHKFKDLITLTKIQEFLKILHHFCMQSLCISLSIPSKLLCLFQKIYFQFSTLQPVADLGLLQHLKWSFFVTAVTTRNRWLLLQIVPQHMLQSQRLLLTAFCVCDLLLMRLVIFLIN